MALETWETGSIGGNIRRVDVIGVLGSFRRFIIKGLIFYKEIWQRNI